MELYHVDTRGDATEGQQFELDLQFLPDTAPPEAQGHIEKIFPEGLSPYGKAILCGFCDPQLPNSIPLNSFINEIVFEFYRYRQYGKATPSRLQSIFALDSKQAAKTYRNKESPESSIYRVKVEDPSGPYDMEHLSAPSFVHGIHQAQLYWEGIEHPDGGLKEYLVEPPITIGEEID